MSDPSDVLGIAPDASLPEIKRAYARALKANRPDDDPVAFGRVQEAYEACVARLRRQESGERDEFDELDEEWFAAQVEDASVTIAEAAPATAESLPDDAVQTAIDAVMQAAHTMPSSEFADWLAADEGLYDLALKRQVGDLILERVTNESDDLPWRTLYVLYAFFEVDSVSDPRLRRDYFAREVWLRVQGDLRFARRVQALHTPYMDFADRMVLAELFEPPDRTRSLKMHVLPMMPGKLRRTFRELSVEDPERAEAALSPRARDYWLPFTDPARLDWRRLLLGLGHMTVLAIPFAMLGAIPDPISLHMLRNLGAITGVLFAIWLARNLIAFGAARYSDWRLRTVGPGEVPAGANILADRATMMAGGSALLSILLAVFQLRADSAGGVMILQIWMVMFMGMPLLRAPRLRWDAVLAVVATAAVAYPIFENIGKPDDFDLILAAVPGAFAVGVLAALLVDALHAHFTRQALADIRDAISWPQCLLAVAATVADVLI